MCIDKGVGRPPNRSAYRIRNRSWCRGQLFHKKNIVRPAKVPVKHIRNSPPNRAGTVSRQKQYHSRQLHIGLYVMSVDCSCMLMSKVQDLSMTCALVGYGADAILSIVV